MNNKLFELFGVKNHLELMNYIKDNPKDERVKEVKELLEMFDINIEEGDKKWVIFIILLDVKIKSNYIIK